MCTQASLKQIIGTVGEADVLKQVCLLQYKFPDHTINALTLNREGNVYDIGIDIDHHFYRGQVKTTEQPDKNGRMTFQTSHKEYKSEGKRNRIQYQKDEIDFFLLYCISEDWLGLALLDECQKTTRIYLNGTDGMHSKVQRNFLFEKRMRELIETGTISPVTDTKSSSIDSATAETKTLVPAFKKPETFSELFNLLAEHGGNIEVLSDMILVPVPVIKSWIDELSKE